MDEKKTIEQLINELGELRQRITELEESKEARDFLENVFSTTADGIIVTDPKGYVVRVNKAVEKMLGYTKEEIIGNHISKHGHKDKRSKERFTEVKKRLQEKGIVKNAESVWLRKDGSLCQVEYNITNLKDKKGNSKGSIIGVRDITERKRSEERIKHLSRLKEDLLRPGSLDERLKRITDGVVRIFDADFSRIWITEPGDLCDSGCMHTRSTTEGPHVCRSRDRCLHLIASSGRYTHINGEVHRRVPFGCYKIGRIASGNELKFITNDVTQDPRVHNHEWARNLGLVSFAGYRLLSENGKPIGVLAFFSKHAISPMDSIHFEALAHTAAQVIKATVIEEKLKKSEENLYNLIEFADVGIITTEKGKIVQVNKRAEEIYGYSRNELIGKSPRILTLAKYRKQHRKMLDELLSSGKAKQTIFEEEGVRKDGTTFPIEISYSLSRPKDKEDYSIIAIMRNITERKEMEHKLLQSEKLKSLGELAGGVAHDFNNVLATILGRVQLLQMQFKPPGGKQEKRKSMIDLKVGLEIIERAAIDGAETVRRIQEFSRRREDDRNFTKVDLNELLVNALEFTQVRWKNEAELKGISINLQKELSPLLPINGSSSELREVFTNLINNALDAMPQGGKLKVKTFKDNSHVVVEVKDTGFGIPKNIKDRVFDPFFTTKGVQSTGLGLSVSYGIINRHRGTIAVDSVEGEGTTFTIKLPIPNETGKQVAKEGKVIPIKRKQKKASILVIEDEKDVRQLLRDILTNAGHNVEIAFDGSEGIKMFEKKEFDLVFTDLGMPGMSGWEVAEKVKSINEKVPVALITGWNVELDESELKGSGINLIIQKPFKMKQVLNLVQEGMILREQFKCPA